MSFNLLKIVFLHHNGKNLLGWSYIKIALKIILFLLSIFFFKYIYQSNIFCLVLTYWWLCFRNLWKKWICIATVLLSHPDFIGRAEQFSYGWPPNLIYLMGCNTQSNGSYEMFAYFQNLAILSGMRPSLLGRYPSFKENSKELQVKHVVVVILEHTKILLVL